jgi:hypothetical protein
MSIDLLDRLAELEATATLGPWYVRFMDDNMCMGAIAISTQPDVGDNEHLVDGAIFGVVAATLIQDPPYIMREDEREKQNADLIAEVRTALPELLRLARIGAAREAVTAHPGEGRGPEALGNA